MMPKPHNSHLLYSIVGTMLVKDAAWFATNTPWASLHQPSRSPSSLCPSTIGLMEQSHPAHSTLHPVTQEKSIRRMLARCRSTEWRTESRLQEQLGNSPYERLSQVISLLSWSLHATFLGQGHSPHLLSFCRSDSYMRWSRGLTLGCTRDMAASKWCMCTHGSAGPADSGNCSSLRASCTGRSFQTTAGTDLSNATRLHAQGW